MIVPDANLLLYAYSPPSAQHAAARTWLERTLSGGEMVGLPWLVIVAFLRIGSNPRAFDPAFDPATGIAIVNSWLAQDRVVVINPGERHWEILAELMLSCQCRGPLLTDAHLAALAIENGALFCTADRGFRRFPHLRWTNPLEA